MRIKKIRKKHNLKFFVIALIVLAIISLIIISTFIKSSNNLILYNDPKAPNFSFKYDPSEWTVEPEDIKICKFNRLEYCGEPVGRGYNLISKKYGENLTLWIGLGLGGSAYIKSLPDLSKEDEHCFTKEQLTSIGNGWYRAIIDRYADENKSWTQYYYRELNFSKENCIKGALNQSAYGEFYSKEHGKYIGAINISLNNRVSREMSKSVDGIIRSLKF